MRVWKYLNYRLKIFYSFYRLKISSKCIFYSRKINSNALQDDKLLMLMINLVVNKAEGRISKWVFQENKARRIFRKTNISYPLIRTRTCAYQGVRNVRFWKIWHDLFSWNTRFEIRPFAFVLSPTNASFQSKKKYYEDQTFTCSKSTIETSEKGVEYL